MRIFLSTGSEEGGLYGADGGMPDVAAMALAELAAIDHAIYATGYAPPYEARNVADIGHGARVALAEALAALVEAADVAACLYRHALVAELECAVDLVTA